MDAWVMGYTRAVIRYRYGVALLSILGVLVLAIGAKNLYFSTDYRAFFGEANPQLEAYEALQRTYSRDDSVQFVIQQRDGDLFNPRTLEGLRLMTEESWQIDYTTRVDGIANFQYSTADGDDLWVRDLVSASADLSDEGVAAIRAAALAEPLLLDRVISTDGRTTSINATVTLPREHPDETLWVMEKAREIAARYRAEYPELRIEISGVVALNAAFAESSQRDYMLLIPVMFAIILVAVGALIRSVTALAISAVLVTFSAVGAMGAAGWLGFYLTPPSAIAPTIILTIAIADGVHVMMSAVLAMRRGMNKTEAIVESMRVNWSPVFLTSLTTVVGFLSLNSSDAPPFGHLGSITSMGVTLAWLLSMTMVPAALAILPFTFKPRPEGTATMIDQFGDWVVRFRVQLLVSVSALVVVLFAVIPRIDLNDQFVEYFDQSLPFRQAADFAQDNLSGLYVAQWPLPSGESGGVQNPEFLEAAENFANWLRDQKGVVHVNIVTDIFKRLNKNMHGDDESYYRLPDTRDLAAQYLLLFEFSLPFGLDLTNQIDVDKAETRVIVTLDNITTVDMAELDSRATAWLAENWPPAKTTAATSAFVMFAYIAERNIIAMLGGTTVAFVLISLTLMLALRNVRLGLISLIPNLVPAGMAFGVWAILVGEVGLAASVITATSLGIIVDATVHFLSKYQRARREKNATTEEAVRYAFHTVGAALWVTFMVLVAGFMTLSLSTFAVNSVMGQLTALALVMALVVDFLLLPPMLMFLDRDKPGQPAPGSGGDGIAAQPAE
jgi:predicted RND superfamily exporter protein